MAADRHLQADQPGFNTCVIADGVYRSEYAIGAGHSVSSVSLPGVSVAVAAVLPPA